MSTAAEIQSALPTCCKLWPVQYPSGKHLTHSRSCPEFPGMKVRDSHPELRRLNPRREAGEPHKECAIAHTDGGRVCSTCAPLLHEKGCTCQHCGYFEAHVDDAPDWGPR